MIGVGIVGFVISAGLFGASLVGWITMSVFAGVFMVGVFKETKGTY